MYEIKKGIPVPEHKNRSQSREFFPFEKMEVGDCIDVYPKKDETAVQCRARIRSVSAMYRARSKELCGWSVSIEKDDAGKEFVRLWKTTYKPRGASQYNFDATPVVSDADFVSNE